MVLSAFTFECRLQDGSRFGRHQDAASVFAQGSALLVRNDQLTNEPCSVSDVIILIILAQVQNVLSQQLRLCEREETLVHTKDDNEKAKNNFKFTRIEFIIMML